METSWYDGLLDAARDALGGIQGEFGGDGWRVTVGERAGPPWPLVAGVMVLLILVLAWRQ